MKWTVDYMSPISGCTLCRRADSEVEISKSGTLCGDKRDGRGFQGAVGIKAGKKKEREMAQMI